MKIAADSVFDGEKFASGTITLTGSRIAAISPGGGQWALAMPGFVDSHVHLLSVGLALQTLSLNNCTDASQFRQALTSYARHHREQWIVGRGWDQNKLGFVPDRYLLDQLCPRRPVVLHRVCGHVLAANSLALALAGVNSATPDVSGGVIKRDSTGCPTGILEEKAMDLVLDRIPRPSSALLYGALAAAVKYAHSCGITGVQTDDLSLVGDYHRLWQLYCDVTAELPLRVQLHHRINSAADIREFVRIRQELPAHPFVSAGAGKIFLDGSLGARTAALLDEYSDQPGHRGVLVYCAAAVKEMVAVAEELQLPLALHAIGDGAIEQLLAVLAELRGGYRRGVRHRLIHCQVTNADQIRRMAALGMVAEIQPVFFTTDSRWAMARLGKARAQTSYCWRSLLAAGVEVVGGSDGPVEDINPWPGIAAAVQTRDNTPGWSSGESLSLDQALMIYTRNSARLAGWQSGVLAAGRPGDLAVFSQFNSDLAVNKPDLVLVDGTIVYRGEDN